MTMTLDGLHRRILLLTAVAVQRMKRIPEDAAGVHADERCFGLYVFAHERHNHFSVDVVIGRSERSERSFKKH